MSRKITARQTRLLRMRSQRLRRRENLEHASPAHVLKEIIGGQVLHLPAALLSLDARSEGLTVAEVELARNKIPLHETGRAFRTPSQHLLTN